MSGVAPDSLVTERTVSSEGVRTKLAGTPLSPYADRFLSLAESYQIDPNWALAYLQMESRFGTSQIGRANPSNPWDILCYPGQWGASGQYQPNANYCYAVYPSVEVGLEAGFRQWRRYVTDGFTTWYATLCRSVSGNGPCEESWVAQVIGQGQYNAERWPYVAVDIGNGGVPPPAPVPGPTPIVPPGAPPAPPPAKSDPLKFMKDNPGLVMGLLGLAAAMLLLMDGGGSERVQGGTRARPWD